MARRKEIKNLFGTLYEYEYDGDKLVSFKKADDKTGKNGISTGKSNAPKKEAPKSAVKKVDDKLSSVSKSLGERVYGETTKDVTLGKDFRQDIKRLDEQKTIEKAEKSISGYAKAKAWAFKMEYERTDGYSRLSSTIGDDIQKLMSDYNNAKNNKVDQAAYDELRERSKKIRDDLRNYHDYYSLYNTDDAQNAKTFGDLEQLASGIHDDLHYSDDVNGFYNRKQSQGVQSYAELRQKRGLLQRRRGSDGYDNDRVNAELEALDKYGYNQNVIDSMTDEDWEYEKQRLGEYAKNAKNEADKIKNTLTGNAPYIAPYLTSDKVNSGNTKEIAGRLKSAEDKFYYYNNLLSEVEELERMTKTEREIAKKWEDYKSKIPDGGVHAKIEAPGNGWEYNAVNYGFVPEEQIVTDATGGGWVANKSEIHNAKLYNFAIADEINMYNYLHDNVSPEKATEYLKDITPILNKRMSQYESAEAYKKAQESPIFATIGSTAYNGLFGGVEALINDAINGVMTISGKEIDPYSPRFQTYRDMQATQQGVKDTIDSKVGKIIYGAGTQIAELTISMLAAQGIGSAIGGLAKGANAAQIANKASNIANQVLLSSKSMLDTTLRYKESGESDLAAVGMGMLSGLIEAYTERKSLSNLLKSPDIFKDMATKVKVGKWVSKIGVDAIREGLEEVEANALNTIAALVFNYRNNDSFLSAIDKAKAEGKSDSEALAEAIKVVAPEYIESFVVGALAGGAFGTVNTASSINTVNNVIDISSDYFGKNGTSRESVERLLIDMGYTDEAEIAKAANAVVRKGNGRSISKDNEALFEDDVRLRGMLYGYVEAVDAGARRDTVSKVLDEARETETPEPAATSVPKNTTVTKPDAELTEEEVEERKQGYALINEDDAEESYRTRGRSGSKVYTYAVNKGGLIDELIKDGYSAEEATRTIDKLFGFMYNQGRTNGNVDIAVKAASENIVSGYEAQAREFFVAGQMDAQGRLIGKTNARLVPNQTLKNMQSNGQINSLAVRAINTLASKLGINIAFSDTMKDGALGSFNKKTGTLLISSKAKNKYFLTAVHESIHTIRSIHPESYNKMNEVVYDILKDNKSVHNKAWNKILSSYRKEATKDGKIDRDLINEELTAKVVSHLLTDEAYIKELAQTNRTTLQRIYDAIVDFFDKIFKRYSEDASPREAEFKDALKELQGEFNTIKAMYENALKETTNVQQSKMVLPKENPDFEMKKTVESTKELIAVHNASEQQLLDAINRGAFLMPSTAVSIKGHTDFGEISVVFPRTTIDPDVDKNNKLFGADAWTPTQTKLKKNPVFNNKAVSGFLDHIRSTIGLEHSQIFGFSNAEFKQAIFDADGSVYSAFAENIGIQTAYALQNKLILSIPEINGKTDMINLKEQLGSVLDKDSEWRKYKNWLNKISDKIISSYDTASNFDIMRNMKSQPDSAKKFRLTETGELTVPAKEYTSVEEYKANKLRLSEDADNETRKTGEKFVDWARKIHKNNNSSYSEVIRCINNAFDGRYNTNDIVDIFSNKGIEISQSEAIQLQNLYKTAVELPTRYFEAKPKREVGIKEIAYVVLPDNASEDIRRAISENDISYIEYENGSEKSRLDALASITDVRFSIESGVVEDNGDLLFNKEQWDTAGRDTLQKYLDSQVEAKEIDKAYAKQIMEFMDVMAKASDEMGAEYLHYNNWANYKIEKNENGAELTCVVKNGDYSLNIDFSTKCVKRETLDAVINVLATKGLLDKVKNDTTAISVINQIIKKRKLDVACNLCFVDAKRQSVLKWANSFSDMWNTVIDLIVPKGDVVPDFGFSDTTGTRTSTVSTLTTPDFDNIEKRIPKKFKTAKGEVKPIAARIINALKADRNLIKHISTNDIASSLGLDLIKRNSETLYNIINSHQGSAKPKLTHGNVPYNNEVINRKFDAKAAFMVGGFRLQSFSDYVSSLFFDYMQTFAEFAAKKMPVHAYTKVMEFVKIFGKTGAKINMSGVPMVFVDAETSKQLSALYENGKKGSKFYNSALVKKLKKTAGLDENGDFIWASESIDIDEARKIAADKEYGKHCGIIAVGVSDAHIWKLLETPWISQVIPYHRSGINTAAARMYNIDLFNDYTLKQNTKVKINGKWVSIHNKNVKVEDFDFYGELMKLGNAENAHIQIANKYVDWCEQNGYLPKFADFVYKTVDGKKVRNENYYKLLADFRMADTDGKYSPQVAVQMNFPETDELLGYIREGLKTEEARKNVVDKNVDSIVAEVREALDIEDDILYSKESTDDSSSENIDPGVQGTQASFESSYFELKKEVKKKLDEHIKKYGAIKKGEDAVRDAQFPVQTSDDRYVRRFTRTAFEADSVTDEVAAEIAEEVANGSLWTTYSRITDKKSVDVALNRFKSVGYDKMLEEWEAKIASNERIEKGDIAKAMVLVQEAGKRGDMKTAMGLIAEIAAEGTRAGQLVQSLSLLKKLSGQANVYYIERTIKQIQKDIDDKYTGRKAKKHVTIKVPEDLLKKYREMYDREKKSGSQDHSGSDKILDDIMKNVAEQVPVTWADKFDTWRYFAMLGNPRTHIRNLAGNTFFMPLILAKNMVAAIGEGLAAPAAKLFGKNMQRTKTLGGVLSFGGEYMRYGKKDAQKIEAMLRGEKKYSELQKIMQGRKIFTSKFSAFFKVNEKVNKNTKRLEQEDWIFLKHNYARALTMYMKANKLSPDTITEKQLETARLYAVREAQKASFRDESALAKAIQRAEKSHKALGFAVGALMPFKQTPINVLKRGVEYSPAGVITTVGKGIRGIYEGKFSATEFIDGLGATLSGTGLCCLGVYLASQGLLFGPGDDDDENRMNILNGIQNYSLKIGNGTYTIDWASPAAMSLFVGCEIWNSLANKEERTFADIVDALMSITEPVFEMSMLEGLMSVFEAGVYATRSSEAAAEALTSIIPNYFSQFVPAILGQIARTIDPVRRKTYVDKNKNVPEWLQLFGQQMAKKFPGTSFLLDPYVNAKGETELNAEGNIFSRAMQNFFSPGYYKSIKSNEVDSEISRLYEKFGSDANGVIPKTVGRKIGDVNLSSEQYTKYQQVTGQAYYSKLKEIISSDYYQNLSDTDKVRLLKKAREYAVEKGKEETLSDYHSSEGWLMKAFETDGLYRHVLNEVKEGKFSEDDLSGDAREFYEEEKDKIFSDILAEYNPDKLDYELADKFYEDLYDLSEKIALEANSDGQYVIEDTWINNAKELEAEERAQYIYGRAILTQYDDQDKANDALQNDSFISDKVRGYLLEKSSFSSDNPSKLYSNHVARHSNEISFEEYTKLWEKWEAAEKYKVGNKTVDKKDQILPEINKLKISNAAKSRIYDSFGWGNSERALKDVPWGYVPDSQSPDVLSKRVGQDISGKSSYTSKNSPYNKNNNDADFGQCVWYARGRAKELLGKNIPAMGNANQMFANAKKNSKVEAKPENLRANMLVTYKTGTSTVGQYAGHVIYIEAVDGDTVYYTEGGNYNMSGKLRTATREDIMTGITDDRKLGSDIIGFIDVTKY